MFVSRIGDQRVADLFGDTDSIAKDLIVAEKKFRAEGNKPPGQYHSQSSTKITDKMVRDGRGNTAHLSAQETRMSMSHSHGLQHTACSANVKDASVRDGNGNSMYLSQRETHIVMSSRRSPQNDECVIL